MSSLEIAELTGKEHRSVLRDIRVMLVELHGDGGLHKFVQTHRKPAERTGISDLLPKRETLIASGVGEQGSGNRVEISRGGYLPHAGKRWRPTPRPNLLDNEHRSDGLPLERHDQVFEPLASRRIATTSGSSKKVSAKINRLADKANRLPRARRFLYGKSLISS